ncbi:hypothetical protein EV424DRAFT_1474084 [Suillus variegatus]|nr:hypothetical protein EV424DRAFT_1474084 [Suillus variegatus]
MVIQFRPHPPTATSITPPDGHPWHPFKSQLEFDVAKLILEVGLNNKQTDHFIKLCHRCAIGKEKMSFRNHKDIHNLWEAASHCVAKFDGTAFVRFIDEPFTSQLPPDAKPLAYILYMDKTKPSLFGTVKGYLVEDKKLHSGKPSWVDFKNAIWHKSFVRIISLLASKSKMEQWFECLDGIMCWFFLLILSLTYRCVMSLTQGIMSLWPCPICLVPQDDLWDTLKTYCQQTSEEPQALVNTACTKETFEEREELLKEQALHCVKSTFWAVAFTCVFHALSHDRCHFNHGGLWSHHLWVELQKYLGILGREALSQVDKRFNLKHPNKVVSVTFTDSSVHEDIFKQYMNQTADDNKKNWNFLKLHRATHIFDDIEAKGALCNYNTKPNEQMHGPLKDWYLNQMNFKNITEQSKLEVDNNLQDDNDSEDVIIMDNGPGVISLDPSLHIKIGSRQIAQTFSSLKSTHQADYTDYLWCNPQFFNTPRFDCVIIRTNNNIILGRLAFLFECTVENNLFPLTLVHPFDAPTGQQLQKDKQLNLFRVQVKPWARMEFLSFRSII